MVYILVTVGKHMGYLQREDGGGPGGGPMIKPLFHVLENPQSAIAADHVRRR
jgi:hypothetical protein